MSVRVGSPDRKQPLDTQRNVLSDSTDALELVDFDNLVGAGGIERSQTHFIGAKVSLSDRSCQSGLFVDIHAAQVFPGLVVLFHFVRNAG